MKRKVLLHFHIFKNAGTTIDSVLEKNFLENAIRGDGEKPKDILPMEIVIDYLNKNRNVKVFSSHQIRFPIPENSEIEFLPLIFIRHPIDRAISTYNYDQNRVDPNSQISFEARTMYLSKFIEWNLHPPRKKTKNMTMKNFQVLYLSHNNVETEVDSNDLNVAIERLKSCPVVGVVDRLDESLVVAEEILRKDFPEIDLSYVKRNVSKNRKDTLQERLDDSESQLEKSLWEDLKKHNELDFKLYEMANKELDVRIKKIDKFEEKLNSFRNRESKLVKRFLEHTSFFKNNRILYSFEKKRWYIEEFEKVVGRMKEANEVNIRSHRKHLKNIIIYEIITTLTKLRIIKPRISFDLARKKYQRGDIS